MKTKIALASFICAIGFGVAGLIIPPMGVIDRGNNNDKRKEKQVVGNHKHCPNHTHSRAFCTRLLDWKLI